MNMPNLKLPRLSLKSTAKSSIALHLTPSRIRLLGLKKDKSPLFSAELLSKEDKAKALAYLVNKHNIKGQEVIACLSANEGLMKFYAYPSTLSKKDLKNSIEWAIKRDILALKEEVYYDYHVLDFFPDSKKVGVIAVMARKETIEGIKGLVELAGLKLKTLDYEVIAIINYGLYHKLPLPFSILHVDYDYSILVCRVRNCPLVDI